MIDLTEGIDSLTNFKRNTPVFLESAAGERPTTGTDH
jgi:hypothetical protein